MYKKKGTKYTQKRYLPQNTMHVVVWNRSKTKRVQITATQQHQQQEQQPKKIIRDRPKGIYEIYYLKTYKFVCISFVTKKFGNFVFILVVRRTLFRDKRANILNNFIWVLLKDIFGFVATFGQRLFCRLQGYRLLALQI